MPAKPDVIIRKLAAIAIWLVIWQLIYMAVGQEVLVVSPAQVVGRTLSLVLQGKFWAGVGSSLLRIISGYALAILIGTALAVLTSLYRFMNDLIQPILSIMRATPVASFIILALVWMATGLVPAFACFLMVLPIIWGNLSEGISATDEGLLEMARIYRLKKSTVVKRIYIPSVMPYFMAAATTSIGIAWKAGIAAEVLCKPGLSIGTYLYNAKIYLETLDVFAYTAVIIIISMLLEKLFVRLMRVAGKRYNVSARRREA